MNVVTREVLADAYKGKRRSLDALLTHAVERDDDERLVRVLCDRVELDSIADGGSLDEADWHKPPTCPVCARRDPRAHPAALAKTAQGRTRR